MATRGIWQQNNKKKESGKHRFSNKGATLITYVCKVLIRILSSSSSSLSKKKPSKKRPSKTGTWQLPNSSLKKPHCFNVKFADNFFFLKPIFLVTNILPSPAMKVKNKTSNQP
jgi:hypothetical protein